MINVAIPFHAGDRDQADRLLNWLPELGRQSAHCFLFAADDANPMPIVELAKRSFEKATYVRDHENIKSNWNARDIAAAKSASGPNSIFRQVAWHFHAQNLGPWLFLEPDAIPCCANWLSIIDAEYTLGRKPFMGSFVRALNHAGQPIPDHMSGVAAYPQETPLIAGGAMRAHDVAFDLAGVKEILPAAHFTRKIIHHFRAPTFNSIDDLNSRCPEGTAIYHACKDGSIIPLLRQRLTGVAQLAEQLGPNETVAGSTPAARAPYTEEEMRKPAVGFDVGFSKPSLTVIQVREQSPTMDIYIKTHPRDYPWLNYCLKSIDKFATGFKDTIIAALDEEWTKTTQPYFTARQRIISKTNADQEPGYLWQQVCKLHADEVTYADYILFMDSDCIFTREVAPSDFLVDGKPIWLMTPFGDAREDQAVWIPVMEKFLGKRPTHEFMRRHPFVVPRGILAEMRQFCRYRHGMELRDYIMAQAVPGKPLALTFSEWNCLGFFAYEFHRDKFHWIDTSKDEVPPSCCLQGYTHSGEKRMREDFEKFERILNPPTEVQTERIAVAQAPGALDGKSGAPALSINDHIQALIDYANRDGFAKARLSRMLRKAGLVPKKGNK